MRNEPPPHPKDLEQTLEIISLPGFHPTAGIVAVVKADLEEAATRQYLMDLQRDAPPNMREAIEKLLGSENITQSIKVPKL